MRSPGGQDTTRMVAVVSVRIVKPISPAAQSGTATDVTLVLPSCEDDESLSLSTLHPPHGPDSSSASSASSGTTTAWAVSIVLGGTCGCSASRRLPWYPSGSRSDVDWAPA